MLDYCSLHDFHHVCAFVLTKSYLCWVPCCWVSFWFPVVLLFLVCLIHFAQLFLSFCVFGKFNLFVFLWFCFWLFFGQTRISCLVYDRTIYFGSTKSCHVKQIWVKGLLPYLFCLFFLLILFWFKVMFGK